MESSLRASLSGRAAHLGKHEQGTEAVAKRISNAFRSATGAAVFAALAAAGVPYPAAAGSDTGISPVISTQGSRVVRGERYIPGISITPDGCEVWVMDDGAEGYAVTRVTPDGRPVCHDINVCGAINTDQYFATDSARIRPQGRARIEEFFRASDAYAFIIAGHTDSRASQEYNQRLSENRAGAVARVAKATGARIVDVRGYGESYPAASNDTAEGMARNRRVEILCLR